MRLFYLVAAHNEEHQIRRICEKLISHMGAVSDIQIYLLDNGSTDQTWAECKRQEILHPKVHSLHCDKAGLGIAFRMGLGELAQKSLGRTDWVVLAAADLPFGFSDIDGVVGRQLRLPSEDVLVYVGSKSHRESEVVRNWKRTIGTMLFYLLRRLVIGMRIRDTQGSIILRGDSVEKLRHFQSDNYFFAVELLDMAQTFGEVTEIPVKLDPELRSSRVSLFKDGWQMLWQLFQYRFRRSEHQSILKTR